ncbi:MAG: hypothetical protein Q4D61_05565 [Cardiobacteriaceae bacterium]|nr:hypothetical protein [Cardiobacteriaceae bacterium]
MQPVFMNLALAFVAGFCATACGNNDSLTLIDAPQRPHPRRKSAIPSQQSRSRRSGSAL